MSEDRITLRNDKGDRLAGSRSTKGKKAPKAPRSRDNVKQGKPAVKASKPAVKPTGTVRAPILSILKPKPEWKPIVQAKRPRVGTAEHIIFQAHGLTEEESLALWKQGSVPNLDLGQNPTLAWGQAQQRAFALLGESRYAKLEALWKKEWPDFSKYRNDPAWDAAWNIAANTVIALSLRGELSQKDYDVLTLPWRIIVGRIHPGDLEVTKMVKPVKQDKVLPLDILNTSNNS